MRAPSQIFYVLLFDAKIYQLFDGEDLTTHIFGSRGCRRWRGSQKKKKQ